MTSSDPDRKGYDHVLDIVARSDVEDYARGRPHTAEMARLVEEVLLEDDAARAILRAVLEGAGHGRDTSRARNSLPGSLHDLNIAAGSCIVLAEIYRHLCAYTDQHAISIFLRGREGAFRIAAQKLEGLPHVQGVEIPRKWPDATALPAPEVCDDLVRQMHEDPASAIGVLADLHRPLMQRLRTAIHRPWPLQTKLQIAEAYALLKQEQELSAWLLKRRTGPRISNDHANGDSFVIPPCFGRERKLRD